VIDDPFAKAAPPNRSSKPTASANFFRPFQSRPKQLTVGGVPDPEPRELPMFRTGTGPESDMSAGAGMVVAPPNFESPLLAQLSAAAASTVAASEAMDDPHIKSALDDCDFRRWSHLTQIPGDILDPSNGNATSMSKTRSVEENHQDSLAELQSALGSFSNLGGGAVLNDSVPNAPLGSGPPLPTSTFPSDAHALALLPAADNFDRSYGSMRHPEAATLTNMFGVQTQYEAPVENEPLEQTLSPEATIARAKALATMTGSSALKLAECSEGILLTEEEQLKLQQEAYLAQYHQYWVQQQLQSQYALVETQRAMSSGGNPGGGGGGGNLKADGTTKKGPQPMLPGDWNCPSCGDHQFSRNRMCRACGAARP